MVWCARVGHFGQGYEPLFELDWWGRQTVMMLPQHQQEFGREVTEDDSPMFAEVGDALHVNMTQFLVRYWCLLMDIAVHRVS